MTLSTICPVRNTDPATRAPATDSSSAAQQTGGVREHRELGAIARSDSPRATDRTTSSSRGERTAGLEGCSTSGRWPVSWPISRAVTSGAGAVWPACTARIAVPVTASRPTPRRRRPALTQARQAEPLRCALARARPVVGDGHAHGLRRRVHDDLAACRGGEARHVGEPLLNDRVHGRARPGPHLPAPAPEGDGDPGGPRPLAPSMLLSASFSSRSSASGSILTTPASAPMVPRVWAPTSCTSRAVCSAASSIRSRARARSTAATADSCRPTAVPSTHDPASTATPIRAVRTS